MSLKVIVRSENFLMTMTLLELYDIIVGYESDVDFTAEKVEHIERLRQQVFKIFDDFLMMKYFKHIKYFKHRWWAGYRGSCPGWVSTSTLPARGASRG